MKKIETVLIPSWMTWKRFGTKNEEYFNQHIKNQKLLILKEFRQVAVMFAEPGRKSKKTGYLIFELQDATGETWIVHEPDLIRDKKEAERLSCPWRDLVEPRPHEIVREAFEVEPEKI